MVGVKQNHQFLFVNDNLLNLHKEAYGIYHDNFASGALSLTGLSNEGRIFEVAVL